MAEKIEGTIDAWESKQLGADEEFVRVVAPDSALDAVIDEAAELQLISIRMSKSLIEDLKAIASLRGLGYQPLMKQVLKRFVECEKKQLLREYAAKRAQEQQMEAEIAIENERKKAS